MKQRNLSYSIFLKSTEIADTDCINLIPVLFTFSNNVVRKAKYKHVFLSRTFEERDFPFWVISAALSLYGVRLFSPFGDSLDSLPFASDTCPCLQRARLGSEVMALGKGEKLGFGSRWQSLLCRAANDIRCSGPFFVELTGGEGSVHHGGWKGFFLQLGAIHVC